MMFKYEVKPNFAVDNEKAISTAPKVDFGNTPAPAVAPVAAPATTPAAAPAPAPAPKQ
jgi:LemA protein